MKSGLFTAAAALLFLGCVEVDTTSEFVPGETVIFSSETDYTTGVLGGVADSTYSEIISPISQDAKVVVQHGDLYILERMETNLIKVSESGVVIYQKRIKEAWSAHDLVVVNASKGYICSNDVDEIAVFDPRSGDISSFIDLSGYVNDSVSTNATAMVVVDSDLYVACQMRNGYDPGEGTLVLKINTETDEVTDTIRCSYKNVSDLDYWDGALYVTNSGSFFAVDGAVEKIDLATKAVSVLVQGETLGFDFAEIALDGMGGVYGALYRAWGDVPVVKYSVPEFEQVGVVRGVVQAVSLQWDSSKGVLCFGETGGVSGGAPAVCVFDPATETVQSYGTTLPPSTIAFYTEMVEL